jgi:site-specific recombinase XerC
MCTGARESAVSEINIENVDFDNNQISGIAKGRKSMTYSFNDTTAKALKEWLFVRDGYAKTVTTDSLFISNRGERIAINSIAKIVKKFTEKALGKPLSPHKLRAGYCTILYEKTGDISDFVFREIYK